MPIATVVGLHGTVVTLTWTTASNAAIAQQALKNITNGVGTGAMVENEYLGGSTLPALGPTVIGVALAEGAGVASHAPIQLGAGPGQYQVGISNDTSASPEPQGWVVPINAGTGLSTPGANPPDTVFVGGGGGAVANFGSGTDVYFAGQNKSPQTLQEIGLFGGSTPSANVWMDGNATVDGSVGTTTVHIDDQIGPSAAAAPFGSELWLLNNNNGTNIVDIGTSNSTVPGSVATDVLFLSGISTVPAVINGAGSAVSGAPSPNTVQPQIWVVGETQAASVNGGSSQLVVFGGSQPLTVNGGSAAGDIGVFVAGDFQAGSGGDAIMAGSITNAASLVGGGNNDVFFGLNNQTTMQAGPGAETEAGFAPAPSAASVSGTVFEGNLGLGAATTTMLAEVGGADKFITGTGVADILALSATVNGNLFQEGVTGSNLTNTATISGFNAGADTISLDIPGGGNYSTVSGSSAAAGQIAVSTSAGNSTLAFGDGTTWTILGATVTGSNFHTT